MQPKIPETEWEASNESGIPGKKFSKVLVYKTQKVIPFIP